MRILNSTSVETESWASLKASGYVRVYIYIYIKYNFVDDDVLDLGDM
jgi:hypothetical protein